MDNVTHSLVGALLGQAGLKRRTGLAMPALVIGANLPDIDAIFAFQGLASLPLRRGVTHGPLAWIVLPLVLTAFLVGFDTWQSRRGTRPARRPPVEIGWIFALALAAVLTHPALDWLNSHGVRLLEPFSDRWFYGDLVFIVDIWLWIGMGFALWRSRRLEYKRANWQRPARFALFANLIYIGFNGLLTSAHAHQARLDRPLPRVVIADQQPIYFWRRTMITGQGDGIWRVDGDVVGDIALDRCDLAAARRADPDVEAFLFWSRAPYVWRTDGGWKLGDARYTRAFDRLTVPLGKEICSPDERG